ncbi:sensor histidine kinase [Streptomyces sp. GbtcB6]|uniref:sensor histidine kinase n=1 Tax=Streptomyces sp. GbtcB6 TaxID=2824751 RepID=UPI001C2F7BD3|nr:sensor histidine kinase [Streptomyces sp. GbtcB6]
MNLPDLLRSGAERVRRAAPIERVCEWTRYCTPIQRAATSVAVALALFAAALVMEWQQGRPALGAGQLAVTALVYASFALGPILRRPPWQLLAAVTVGAIVMTAAGIPQAPVGLALVVAVFAFSLGSDKSPVCVGTTAATGAWLLARGATTGLNAHSGLSGLAVAWVWGAAATGQAIRAGHAQRSMLEDRARRAEQGREEEARRRVQAERLRIARELHDPVGHHVALISVQAGAMSYVLESEPDKARQSLAHIQQASQSALEELRLAVGLLRQPGEHEPVEPAGRLGRLDDLIASFTATGLLVACDVTGQARALPEAVDLTAYRIVQESLTNSAKHAAGTSATITLAFRPGTLTVAVEDDGPPTSLPPTHRPPHAEPGDSGHGIVGMRERAAALGGRLTVGPRTGGGYRVLAELPAPAQPTSPGATQ